MTPNAELADWCQRQSEDAARQIELFGAGGVRALLEMPDGTTQDITAGVVAHQTDNIAMFARLIAALTA
ncbi:hypothetical protein KZX46_17510 [Polymorphobacter sp. PAMC 29334]|uniref:hypothetical protein n=1 Tax=Polymorphobacter sp. PAMC 29334 TaxID=2862331 RepID=UPI001C74E4E8|nr:hypothetical protein [Polymorphobacter sp. PAMC 29334]QYE34539.1 hypothetical protein KZX46_17510 [Polymorphobacter sp. PAMC 29334]